MNTSTSPGISQRTTTYAEAKMLKHAEAVVVLEKFAKPYAMPKNKGVKAEFRRPKPFAALSAPLTEGVTPTGTTFEYENVEVVLQQYGQWVPHTDVIQDTHEDPVLNDMTMMVGENVGRTQEALDWSILRGGSNVFFANGTQRDHVNTPITLGRQRAVIRALQAQKSKKITNIVTSSFNFGTQSVWVAYVAAAHTDCESDIQNLPGFKPVADYGSRNVVSPYEIGSVENVRYVLSPDLEPFRGQGSGTANGMVATSTVVDVYPIVYMGQDAWARVMLRGQGSIQPRVVSAGSQANIADPLAQKGFVSAKFWHAAVITNHAWLARLEVGVTAL
jgi:N4-gp56 family major capsid protein